MKAGARRERAAPYPPPLRSVELRRSQSAKHFDSLGIFALAAAQHKFLDMK
jgi:hypothetical protein